MEVSSSDLQQSTSSKPKGGLITMPFIIVNEAFEKVASYGLLPNMILYLMKDYHMNVATGTSILSLWSAVTNFMPIVGAFFSDSYLGRFRTIALGSFSSLLGMILLWLTTMFPRSKPPLCDILSGNCKSGTPSQLTLLFSSFVLMSIGAGGIRPCSLAFGADQIQRRNDHKSNDRLLQSFFNWYYASTASSVVIALTLIVYIQDHFGWKLGFGVPVILMFLSAALFLLASPYYIKVSSNKSLFSGFAHVMVASFRNKHFSLPPKDADESFHHNIDSNLARLAPTQKLRFLNKACIIIDPDKDLKPDGTASNPWRLCTVDQVEELKSLLKVIPIWSTSIILGVTMSQSTFPLLQANTMDRHLTSKFQVPAGSFTVFMVLTLTIWVAIYDRLILPLLVKLTGRPYGLSLKERMGIGLVLSIMSTSVSAIVEGVRRRRAIQLGFLDNPYGVLNMSAFWLVPQYSLSGLAEAFNAIAQTEFFYSEFPNSMSSIGTSLVGLGLAFGNLFVGVIVNIVDDITKKGGKESWVSNNLNRGHYDYYYWVITVLSVVNFLYFLVCSWAYGPCEGERRKVDGEREEMKKEEEREEKVMSKSKELEMIASS